MPEFSHTLPLGSLKLPEEMLAMGRLDLPSHLQESQKANGLAGRKIPLPSFPSPLVFFLGPLSFFNLVILSETLELGPER